MNLITEYDIKPGCYCYKSQDIIVVDLITHDDMANKLPDPLVVFRDVMAPLEHINGRPTPVHRRYSMEVKKWKTLVSEGTIKLI